MYTAPLVRFWDACPGAVRLSYIAYAVWSCTFLKYKCTLTKEGFLAPRPFCKGYGVQRSTFVDKKCSEKTRSFHMGGSRGGGQGVRTPLNTPPPPPGIARLLISAMLIFSVRPLLGIWTPPLRKFSGSANVPSMHRSTLVRPLCTCELYKRELSEYKKNSNHLSTFDCAAPG